MAIPPERCARKDAGLQASASRRRVCELATLGQTPTFPQQFCYSRAVMNRCAVVVLALALAAGCKSSGETASQPSPQATTSAPSAAAGQHVRITKAPPTGEVEPIVREALANAAAEKRRVVVYVGATWCEPCQRFHHAAEGGELDATFPDLTLLEFDLDRDGERLASAGYVSKYIPLFALPSPNGTASGKQVEGGIKGPGAVAFITPKLQNLLSE
jgi:thiol-disulfide isomerase/thioredoxin